MLDGLYVVGSDARQVLSHRGPVWDALGDRGQLGSVVHLAVQEVAILFRNEGQEALQRHRHDFPPYSSSIYM